MRGKTEAEFSYAFLCSTIFFCVKKLCGCSTGFEPAVGITYDLNAGILPLSSSDLFVCSYMNGCFRTPRTTLLDYFPSQNWFEPLLIYQKKKRAPNMIFRIWSSRPIRSQSKLILGKHKKFMIQSFLFFCTSKHFSIELLGRDTQDQRLPTIQLGPYF